jgi:hypothetical protein
MTILWNGHWMDILRAAIAFYFCLFISPFHTNKNIIGLADRHLTLKGRAKVTKRKTSILKAL